MLEVVTVTVAPRRDLIGVVNAGLAALCGIIRFPEDKAKRLQLATEEVFAYAISTIKAAKLNSEITVRFRHHAGGFQIILEYHGPRGSMDENLRLGNVSRIQVKSFEALGLCLAEKVLDSLTTQHWPKEGITTYILSLNSGDYSYRRS